MKKRTRQSPALPPGSAEKLEAALKKARTAEQLKRVMCLWLRASLRLTSAEVGKAIGWSAGAVQRLQWRYLHEGEAVLHGPGRGGRRHQYLTFEAERDLLDRLRSETGPDGVLKAAAIHLAYEKAAGRTVPKSTVYRMLARHGWRKSAVGSVKPKKKDTLVQVRGAPMG
ncbi:MAG TPA: hypothetical protein VIX19_00880 [Terriglobales bacterium]